MPSTSPARSFLPLIPWLPVLAVIVSLAAVDSASADVLSLTWDDRNDHLLALSGGGACTTAGSYDSTTYAWQQTHDCQAQSLIVGDFSDPDMRFALYDEYTVMDALVDNDGGLISGTFSWFAAIPELGINDVSLIGSGNIVGVDAGISTAGSSGGPHYAALFAMEFIIDEFADFAPVIEWYAYASSWPEAECLNGLPSCNPWSRSREYSGSNNYTGTNFFFYDEQILVPVPGTLPLYVLGLALFRRRLAMVR